MIFLRQRSGSVQQRDAGFEEFARWICSTTFGGTCAWELTVRHNVWQLLSYETRQVGFGIMNVSRFHHCVTQVCLSVAIDGSSDQARFVSELLLLLLQTKEVDWNRISTLVVGVLGLLHRLHRLVLWFSG